jgi:hypothetical protein
MPAKPGQLLPPPATEPGLIPEAPDAKPRGKAPAKSEKKSKTQVAEEELAQLIQFRQAKNRALVSDPSLQTEYHDANAAHTDAEKRAALKKYYTRLYARIRKLEPRVKKLATEREQLALRRLEQRRVSPSEMLDPADRAASFNLSADSYLGAEF